MQNMQPVPMVGRVFSRWTVIAEETVDGRRQRHFRCRCECGTERVVDGNSVRRGRTKSCGCLRAEVSSRARSAEDVAKFTKHGISRTRGYTTWAGMIARCYDPRHKSFANYGGRGITVCDRWRESVEAFIADMGHPPDDLTLDRVNNDLGYSPENCRWATLLQQASNRRPPVRRRRRGPAEAVCPGALPEA